MIDRRVVCACAVVCSLIISTQAEAKRLSFPRLFNYSMAKRTTALRLLRYVGLRVRKASAVSLTSEPVDEQHPALSRPDDLPKKDWPNRAVATTDAKLYGARITVRWLTELAAIKDAARKKTLLRDKAAALVLLLSVKKTAGHRSKIRTAVIAKAMARLGVGVALTGEIGGCDAKKNWCYLQRYQIPANRRRRRGMLILELSRPASEPTSTVRAIKLIRYAQ